MTTTDTALAATVEARLSVLRQQRQRDRYIYRPGSPARHDREVELLALLRLVRSARRLARAVEEREEPISAAKAERMSREDYHGWQAAGPISEAELWGGYAGRRP